jgi:peptidyl-prolyl cis-trans isomerase D
MLQTIRDRFHGLFSVILLGAMAVALTLSFVDTDTLGGASGFAARVNGEEIPLDDFRQIAERQVLEQEQKQRGELSGQERQQIEKNVLEGMVRNRVVAQYVRDGGYRVSDQRVAEHIRSLPVFQIGGTFSQDGYLATLASQNVSPAAFEEERRAALQIEDLQRGLMDSSFFTPAEFRRFVVLEGESRRAAFAVLNPRQFAAQVTVSDEEIKAYYERHPQQFESQESASVDYVDVSAGDVAPAGEPAEEELRALYEASPERFRSAEQRRARHILIAVDQDTDDAKARTLATELRSRLEAGEEFGELARRYSDDPGSASAGGDLGWAGKGTYVAPFEDVVFQQSVGDISPPVKTEFGYHVVQLQEIRPGTQRSFDEVQSELAGEARSKGAQEAFFALTEKMDDAALENPNSLDAVAAATGRAVQRIDMFTRDGGGPFGGNRSVIDAVFSATVLEDGENSPLIQVGENRAIVLRVVEHRPARLRSLEEVRPDVENAVRTEKAATLAAERGGEILAGARDGAVLSVLVEGAGAKLQGPEVLTRTSQEIPGDLLLAIFRASRPVAGKAELGGVALSSGGYGLFRLEEIIPANPEDIPREQRDARKDLLARQVGASETTALAVDLRNSAEVIVGKGLFEEADSL